MIAGVLFDLGGTLLDYGRGSWEQAMAAAYLGVHRELKAAGYRGELAAFRRFIYALEDRLWEEAIAGGENLTLEREMVIVARELGIEPDPALVTRCVQAYVNGPQDNCEPYPDSQPALAALRGQGLKIGLISNTSLPGHVHAADLARYGLLEYFDDLVFSSDAGLWKPQAAVFEHALSRLGLWAEEALFVGDKPEYDVLGARNAGLRAALIEREAPSSPASPDGIEPDWRLRALTELPAIVEALGKR